MTHLRGQDDALPHGPSVPDGKALTCSDGCQREHRPNSASGGRRAEVPSLWATLPPIVEIRPCAHRAQAGSGVSDGARAGGYDATLIIRRSDGPNFWSGARGEGSGTDLFPHPPHGVKVIRQIVDGVQHLRQQFVGSIQVPQVGPRVARADFAPQLGSSGPSSAA